MVDLVEGKAERAEMSARADVGRVDSVQTLPWPSSREVENLNLRWYLISLAEAWCKVRQ